MKVSLHDIAIKISGILVGDATIEISVLSAIDDIQPGSLVFAEGQENLKKAEASLAGAIIVNTNVTSDIKPVIQVSQPLHAFIELIHFFYPEPAFTPGIHPTAIIEEGAVIENGVYIGPYVYVGKNTRIKKQVVIHSHVHIGENVDIGEHTTLYSHVAIYHNCSIGQRVRIHSGSVIGSDGFGYTFVDGQHMKIPHVGKVVIEDDVEIGANTVVDRATLGSTVVGKGTKIDNLVQVAHSVKIGKHNILCAFTGIAGSTITGDRVICAANVGVSDHVLIENDVILAARTGVPSKKILKEGQVYLGNPARPKDRAIEQEFSLTRIPFIRKQIQALQDRVSVLEGQPSSDE